MMCGIALSRAEKRKVNTEEVVESTVELVTCSPGGGRSSGNPGTSPDDTCGIDMHATKSCHFSTPHRFRGAEPNSGATNSDRNQQQRVHNIYVHAVFQMPEIPESLNAALCAPIVERCSLSVPRVTETLSPFLFAALPSC